jgi:hypothetical protein
MYIRLPLILIGCTVWENHNAVLHCNVIFLQIHGSVGRYNDVSIVWIIPDFLMCNVFGRSLHYHGKYLTYYFFKGFAMHKIICIRIISRMLHTDLE